MLDRMGSPRQGLAFELLAKEKILISYQGPHATPEEWDRYISLMRTLAPTAGVRFLVWVEGPPPSAANQRRIMELVRRDWPVALVSTSTAMRFVVSTFSLVNRTIRFFSPDQLSDALTHLHCAIPEAAAVHGALDRLRTQD
jgi:hypothetical protein